MIYVVSGSGRAGTSMMLGCLKKGGIPIQHDPNWPSTGEDDDFPHLSFPAYLQAFMIKTPESCENLQGYGIKISETVLHLFPPIIRPDVKVIWMWRKAEHVLASQKHAFETKGFVPIMMLPKEYKAMQKYYRRQAKKNGFDVLDAKYENTIKHPLWAMKRIAKFLNFDGFDFGKASLYIDPMKQRQK